LPVVAGCSIPSPHRLLTTEYNIAYCLLPGAYCLLPAACCLLPATYGLLPVVPAAYCLLHIACCPLPIACCRWLLRVLTSGRPGSPWLITNPVCMCICLCLAARSGPRFAPLGFLLLAGYENLTAPLFALSRYAKLPEVHHSDARWISVP
jgi:hypothetical protein